MSSPSLRINIIANFIGRFWGSLISLLFVPVYINYIGVEAYGLLGVFNTVQAVLALLDLGLSTTLNREVARFSALNTNREELNDLVFSLQRFYFITSAVAGIALVIASWLFAANWVNAESLTDREVIFCFIIMALNFSLQFPASLYQGGLAGLQKQVTLNVIMASIATLKAVGALVILAFVSPTIQAFLLWQLFLSIIQLAVLKFFLWKSLPAINRKPKIDLKQVYASRHYTVGVIGISLLSILLTQSDKIILSKLVSLTSFGYYSLAATIAGSLSLLLFPVTSAVFPKLTELIAKKQVADTVQLFHRACQLVSIIIIPLGLSLFIFAGDILQFWTRNPAIVLNSTSILRFLVLGTTINSLMLIPYQYTLSVGWVRYGLHINFAAVLFFLPVICIAVYYYGAKGAAITWMVLNLCYLVFAMLYLFSRQLKSEKMSWYLDDILRPAVICLLFAVPFYFARNYLHPAGILSILSFVFCLLVLGGCTLWWGTPAFRLQVAGYIRKAIRKQI